MWIKQVIIPIFLITATVSGVYATWAYAEKTPTAVTTSMDVSLLEFEFKPEEVLPDDEQSSQLGENHLALIKKIIEEASYGLNATKKPIIHNLLNNVGDVVYCQQNVQGGNLKHLMIDGTDAYNLLFQIEYVNEQEYVAYTYLRKDATDNAIGTEIEVYKTIMSKTEKGVWEATRSYEGVAKVATSQHSGVRAINSVTFRTT